MKARPYNPESDHSQLKSWAKNRASAEIPPGHLPENGWIVDNCAAIFLFNTDSKVGILDFFISNPDSDPADRLKACDMLIRKACEKAEDLGKDVLFGHTAIHKVMALGFRYGFKADARPYYFFRKDLNHAAGSTSRSQ